MKNILAALFISTATIASAGVEWDDLTKSLVISGETTAYQVGLAMKAMDEHEVDTIYMIGPGGDYYAGLSLGRSIKEEGARVIIPEGSTCASACAFASMGGSEVFADGEWLFHAPYMPVVPINVTIEEISLKHGEHYIDLAEYVLDMGYGMDFVKKIISTTKTCEFLRLATDGSQSHVDKCKK